MAYSAITNPVIEKKNFWVVWAVECTQKWFFLIYNGLLINRITRYFMKGWDVWVSNNRLLNGLTRIYFKQEILHFNQCDTLWRITCRIYYIFIFSFYFWLKCGLFSVSTRFLRRFYFCYLSMTSHSSCKNHDPTCILTVFYKLRFKKNRKKVLNKFLNLFQWYTLSIQKKIRENKTK